MENINEFYSAAECTACLFFEFLWWALMLLIGGYLLYHLCQVRKKLVATGLPRFTLKVAVKMMLMVVIYLCH